MRYTNLANRLNDDTCTQASKKLLNDSIIDNRLDNFYYNKDCDCSALDEIAMENNFVIKEGYGNSSGCTIDADSDMRFNSAVTHDKGRIQLCSRTYQGVPNLNKGGLIPNVESRLKNADDTSDIRNLDKVMEKTFNSFTPMLACLNQNIQNTQNIIPQWQWGGAHTRQDMVSNKYLEKCGFEYSGKNWVRRETK